MIHPSHDRDLSTNNIRRAGAKSNVASKKFGETDGRTITEFTLTNASGMQVSIINYGATVTRMLTPDSNGNMGDVVLGFDCIDGYIKAGNSYFGCVVGRYANRIADGKFRIAGKEYLLARNNNGNSLHGGNKGFDKVVWDAVELPGHTGIQFSHFSKDGEEGYPGNLSITVTYILTEDNALKIAYAAETDQPTPVNLTNHCYFNLSAGGDPTILNHELMLNADKYVDVNDALIPTGALLDVKNTAMDFRSFKTIGSQIDDVNGGYDHTWVINESGNGLHKAAALWHAPSGRLMEVYTTEPGIQFYSGNFLDGSLKYAKNGHRYIRHAGLCLETQHFPDSPNQPSFPDTILKPGEKYAQTSVYKFSFHQHLDASMLPGASEGM